MKRTILPISLDVVDVITRKGSHPDLRVCAPHPELLETSIKPPLYARTYGDDGVRGFERVCRGGSLVQGCTVVTLQILHHQVEASLLWGVHGGTGTYADHYQFSTPMLDTVTYQEPVVVDFDVDIRFRDGRILLDEGRSQSLLAKALNAMDEWKGQVISTLPRVPRAETLDLRDCCLSADPERCDEWQTITIEHEDRPALMFTGRLLSETSALPDAPLPPGGHRYIRYRLYKTAGDRLVCVYQMVSTYPGERTVSFSAVADTPEGVVEFLGGHRYVDELLGLAGLPKPEWRDAALDDPTNAAGHSMMSISK